METYTCGNLQYKGSQDQTARQKADLALAFEGSSVSTGSADYVLAWFAKGRSYLSTVRTEARSRRPLIRVHRQSL